MSISDKFYRMNGCTIQLDLQGLPEKIRHDLKCITNCPWLIVTQKIALIEKVRKNYLTQIEDKTKLSDRNHL